jgi:hypothetical protein
LHELLVVTGLTGFAISQPLLSVLGDNPIVFTRGRVVGSSLVIFVLVLALVPPLLLWGVGALASLVHRRLGNVVHLVTVGALVGLTVIQLLRQLLDVDEALPLGLAALGSALLFVAAYDRAGAVALWSRFTAPLPLLAVALFLLSSPAGTLAREQPSIEPIAAVANRTGPPIVFVVLDEFPTRSLLDADGGLDPVRFPRLAEFAGDATWYRHYTTVAPVTTAAVPALLSGKVPTASLATAANHPDNLFTLLAPSHELIVSESATSLCVFDRCEDPAPRPRDAGIAGLLGTAFDIWEQRVALQPDDIDPLDEFAEEPASATPGVDSDDSLSEIIDGAFARKTPARLTGFIDSFDPERPPALYYLHAMVPHQPWVTWPDGTGYDDVDVLGQTLPDADRAYRYSWSESEATLSEQRHLLQAQNTDRFVGQIIDELRDIGMYDESLVVFVADHGVSFETRTHSRVASDETLDSIAYAPLLVKLPGQTEGVIDDTNILSIDVLPTIAAAIDVEVPWAVDGFPVGSPGIAARGTTKPFYFFPDIFARELERIGEFDDATTFPSAADRWIGPLAPGADPSSSLWSAYGVSDLIGRDVGSFDLLEGGEASVVRLDDVVDPPPDEPPVGVVQGYIVAGPDQGHALLAVDGTVVAGGPLTLDAEGVARFALLVEPGTITSGDVVELLVQDQGVTARLTLEG